MTNQEQIQLLMQRFVHFYPIVPGPLKQEFDGDTFDEWAHTTGISTSELIICQFILMVWDYRAEWKCGRFYIADALTKLHGQPYDVIQWWCSEPFFIHGQ